MAAVDEATTGVGRWMQRRNVAELVLRSLFDGEEAMTQEEIAQEVGVSVRTVSRWWTGRSVPSKKHLTKLTRLAAD